jgi:hypothetical protein
MCGAPEAFGARTFSTVITTSMAQDLKEKIAGIDCMMRCLYCCVPRIVAAPNPGGTLGFRD